MATGIFEEDVTHFDDRNAGDSKVYVKFYIKPFHLEEESAQEGRPIYKDREYIEIRTPGQQTNIIQRPVNEMDRRRFPKQYRMFKEGNEEQVVGTPLTEVPWLTRSQVEELSYLRIRTLEALADLDDGVCNKHAGLYGLKNKAKAAVEKAAGQAPILDLQRQIDELKNLADTQAQTIREQSEVIGRLRATAKE